MTEPAKTENAAKTEDERKAPNFADVTTRDLFKVTGYQEDPNWVPSPFDQFGTVHTAGTAGDDVHGNVTEVSPAFAIGRARNLVHAARALDPEDPTPPDNVVLPNADHRSEDVAREEVLAQARAALDQPVEIGMTDARRRAAETEEPVEDEKVETNRSKTDEVETGTKTEGEPAQGGWVKQEA